VTPEKAARLPFVNPLLRTVADRVSWQQADLLTWTPPAGAYDLVSAFFVHLPGRGARGVAAQARRRRATRRHPALRRPPPGRPGGRRPAPAHARDVATGEELAELLDPEAWTITTAAPDRPGEDEDGNPVTLHDAVLRAVRA